MIGLFPVAASVQSAAGFVEGAAGRRRAAARNPIAPIITGYGSCSVSASRGSAGATDAVRAASSLSARLCAEVSVARIWSTRARRRRRRAAGFGETAYFGQRVACGRSALAAHDGGWPFAAGACSTCRAGRTARRAGSAGHGRSTGHRGGVATCTGVASHRRSAGHCGWLATHAAHRCSCSSSGVGAGGGARARSRAAAARSALGRASRAAATRSSTASAFVVATAGPDRQTESERNR
jgi:hypothetical protein